MRLIDFVQDLRFKVEAAISRDADDSEIVAAYVAPSSGFLGPHFRPRYLGDTLEGEGRYGLMLRQGRRLLFKLRGEAPPRRIED